MTRFDKKAGCLFGTAIGDALGANVEFLTVAAILQRYPDGPQEPTSCVTDDTQMMLAVGEALKLCGGDLTPQRLEKELRSTFVTWLDSPDNNRAPGMTCLSACRGLASGIPWTRATVPESKGCGANMRVQPVGLLNVEPQHRSAIAQFQAALTHGHATALAAADLTAFAISQLFVGVSPADLPTALREYTVQQFAVYHHDWLGNLWQQAQAPRDAIEFISRGWNECLTVLDRLEHALEKQDVKADPCDATGDGWIAEEAFATGLLCFLLHPDDPVAAVRRAAVTRGDSDSIACLTGAFAGAAHGVKAWPEQWVRNIEYHDRLLAVAQSL